jgi:CRISPR-associated protein Cas1
MRGAPRAPSAVQPPPAPEIQPPPEARAPEPQFPPVIPARMLNEFVYCPRLFYYEHVEGVFLHNADTVEGKHQHRRVDRKKSGKLPPPAATAENAPGNGPQQPPATPPQPDADAQPETIHARSVELGSDTLGVSAKLDLVEIADAAAAPASVQPVEYKRGAPAEGDGGEPAVWDADKMQLGLQILLLRENGYPCESGVLFYRATRQRVTFAPSATDIEWITDRLSAARACMAGPLPAPLDCSPKCPRCSLVPVCLPEESRLLKKLAAEDEAAGEPDSGQLCFDFMTDGEPLTPEALPDIPPDALIDRIPDSRFPSPAAADSIRRLIAPNDETRALYLNTPGTYVARRGDTLTVKYDDDTTASYRLLDIHHIALFGPIQLSTSVIQACCEHGIAISYFSMGGFFYGFTRGHTLPNVTARIAQFAAAASPERAVRIARAMLHGKIRNQRTLLQRNHASPEAAALRALKWLAVTALGTDALPALLGIEGAAARVYFASFSGMLRVSRDRDTPDLAQRFAFDFRARNRRPPRDPVNAVLSLLYAVLAKDCAIACHACGLDPYVGFLHQPRHGKPSLALVLREEFRPLLADSAAITLFNNRMVDQTCFVTAGRAVVLTPAARKTVFLAYEKRMADTVTHPVFGYKVSYRRALELQARLLSKVLTGEAAEYIPFTTR